MSTQPDLKKFMVKVQGGRMYLSVAGRLVWFRQDHPDWGIVTEIVEINHEKQFAIFRARIYNESGQCMATATKREDVKGFGDWLEKAETGAIGRALNLCGFGTDDMDEPEPPQPSQGSMQHQHQSRSQQTAQHPHQGPVIGTAADQAADYRRKATNVHGRWEKGIQEEWLAYIKETYGAESIAQVSDKHIHALWQEMVEAQKELSPDAKPGPQAAPNP